VLSWLLPALSSLVQRAKREMILRIVKYNGLLLKPLTGYIS